MAEMTTAQIQNNITEKATALFETAKEHYNLDASTPKIRLDLTGGVAGRANYCKNYVRYNVPIAIHNYDAFMNRTVGHEIAHIVAHCLEYSCKPHGNTWKKVMRFFGLTPSRCHNYDMSAIPKTRKNTRHFLYSCGCPDNAVTIGLTRHKRALRGGRYTCGKCRQVIKFVREK